MRIYYAIRCKLGMPVCYRKMDSGINYAMCKWCDRQSEIHDFGGPRPPPWGES